MLRKLAIAGAIALALVAAAALLLPAIALWPFVGCYFTFGVFC